MNTSDPNDPDVDQESALVALGWDDGWRTACAASPGGGEPGRVIRHDGVAVLTTLADSTRHLQLRPAVPPLAVGDWVTADGESVGDLLPRRSLLERLDPSTGAPTVVAANIDLVLIVCGLDRPLRAGRVQRFVAQARDAGALPVLVLTKTDLAEDLERVRADAHAIDPHLEVFEVSATSGAGMDALATRIAGTTMVAVGESGAGKSTLANALCGEEVAATAAVRGGDAKGRHTTTSRHLHLLPMGGCLIDTPGVRAVGLSADTDTVEEAFDDIAELALRCKFTDCGHDTEPGCAVRAAVDDGSLAAQRLDSWHHLRGEVAEQAERKQTQARRRRR